jgi:hypothetical protein
MRLELQYDETLSNFAFIFNLRCYNKELFEGNVTLSLDVFTDLSVSATGRAVILEPLSVSATYNTDEDKLSVQGTGGVMELGTMPVSGVEVAIEISGWDLTVPVRSIGTSVPAHTRRILGKILTLRSSVIRVRP